MLLFGCFFVLLFLSKMDMVKNECFCLHTECFATQIYNVYKKQLI